MFLQSCQSMCLKWFRKVICSVAARGVHLYLMRSRFPFSFILKHTGLSVSSSGLRPPVFVLSWSLKFSHHFFLLFPILTLQLSDRHASFATDLLPVLPPPKISPFLLISLRGNEKCSVAAGGSAVVLCMDVKISEAVHVTHVGWGVRNGLIWISVGAPQWVEGKLHTCMFTWFVAADTTTKIRTGCWFTQIHQHCGCFSSREKYVLNRSTVCLHMLIEWLKLRLTKKTFEYELLQHWLFLWYSF